MFELEVGDVIDGGGHGRLKFQITAPLGVIGGQSFAYRARVISEDPARKQSAFIKLYHDLELNQMGLLDMFFKEIATLIPADDHLRMCLPLNDSSDHGKYQPAIGEAGDTVFIGYRWIEGETLLSWLKREQHDDEEKRRLIIALLHICIALSRAHIIHLDLKPENLLINTHHGLQYLTLIDMDLAQIQDPVSGVYKGVRHVGGTHLYASPEQYSADGSGVSDKSDVFSLSILLSQLLLDYYPFYDCDNYCKAIFSGAFKLPDKGYHPNIMRALRRGLHPSPGSRPTMMQLATAFRRYAATFYRHKRCGIMISDGSCEYTYWKETILSGQDLRGFGVLLPSRGSLGLKIDPNKGEYGVQVIDKSLSITLNNSRLTSGRPFWLSSKNVLSIEGKTLNLLLIEE